MNGAMPPDLVGARISHYIVTQRLAQGGMGVVYRAVHHDPELRDMQRVIKLLLPNCAANPDIVRRFKGEAAIAARLRHRNIVEIYEFGVYGDQCYLVLPFLEGLPLDALLERQPQRRMTEHRALKIIVQVAAALHHAHAAGVIHRDLKPGNVFVIPMDDNPEHVNVIDFGIAKAGVPEEFATRAGMVMGTPAYMPPEQYVDASKVAPQADIFALGVMTFEMVTGRLPWPNGHPFEAPQLPDPTMMSPFWPTFCQVLLRAFATDPAARWVTVGEFAIALASTLPALPDEPSGDEIVADLTSFKKGASGAGVYRTPARAGESWPAPAISQPSGMPFRTTLTSASGASVMPAAAQPPSTRPSRRWATATAFVALAAVAIAVAAIYGSGTDSSRTGAGSVEMQPAAAPAADTSPTAVIDAGVTDAPPLDIPADVDAAVKLDAAATEATEPARRDPEPKRTTNGSGSRTRRAVTPKEPAVKSPKRQSDDTYDPNAIGGEKK